MKKILALLLLVFFLFGCAEEKKFYIVNDINIDGNVGLDFLVPKSWLPFQLGDGNLSGGCAPGQAINDLNGECVAIPPSIVDTNTVTALWTDGSGRWLIDVNTIRNLKADGNFLCNATTCYLISDLNRLSSFMDTNWETSWVIFDANMMATYMPKSWLPLADGNLSSLSWVKLQNYPTGCPSWAAVQVIGDTLTCVDINAIVTDTNWQTSWTIFDQNMMATYIPKSWLPLGDGNLLSLSWVKLQNYPSGCAAWQAVQVIGDTLTCVDINGLGIDTNWMYPSGSYLIFDLNMKRTYVRQSDANSWFARLNASNTGDLNVSGLFRSDKNLLCDQEKCYIISDLNRLSSFTDTNWQTSYGLLDTNLKAIYVPKSWLPLTDGNVGNSLTVDWNGLQFFPTGCATWQAVRVIGTTLTCVDINATFNDSNIANGAGGNVQYKDPVTGKFKGVNDLNWDESGSLGIDSNKNPIWIKKNVTFAFDDAGNDQSGLISVGSNGAGEPQGLFQYVASDGSGIYRFLDPLTTIAQIDANIGNFPISVSSNFFSGGTYAGIWDGNIIQTNYLPVSDFNSWYLKLFRTNTGDANTTGAHRSDANLLCAAAKCFNINDLNKVFSAPAIAAGNQGNVQYNDSNNLNATNDFNFQAVTRILDLNARLRSYGTDNNFSYSGAIPSVGGNNYYCNYSFAGSNKPCFQIQIGPAYSNHPLFRLVNEAGTTMVEFFKDRTGFEHPVVWGGNASATLAIAKTYIDENGGAHFNQLNKGDRNFLIDGNGIDNLFKVAYPINAIGIRTGSPQSNTLDINYPVKIKEDLNVFKDANFYNAVNIAGSGGSKDPQLNQLFTNTTTGVVSLNPRYLNISWTGAGNASSLLYGDTIDSTGLPTNLTEVANYRSRSFPSGATMTTFSNFLAQSGFEEGSVTNHYGFNCQTSFGTVNACFYAAPSDGGTDYSLYGAGGILKNVGDAQLNSDLNVGLDLNVYGKTRLFKDLNISGDVNFQYGYTLGFDIGGSNPCAGTANLVAGAAQVSTSCAKANSAIIVQRLAWGGTVTGASADVTLRQAGRFDINAFGATLDTSLVYWEIRRVY